VPKEIVSVFLMIFLKLLDILSVLD
jgi:hypothetical protein